MIRKMKWHKASALVMSVAMGFSSFSAALPGGVVYAENGDPVVTATEASAEASSESSTVEASEASSAASVDNATAEDSRGSEVVDEASTADTSDVASEESTVDVSQDKEEVSDEASLGDTVTLPVEEETSDRNFDESKTDVWDFGAENLGDAYNNRLDEETINGFYSVAAGSTGVNIASFSVDNGDFVFEDGGFPATHRLRTMNTALTRYDEKSKKDSDGNVYNGFIYSNKGSTDAVYVALECQADDTITAYIGSNGADSQVHFQNTSDATDDSVVLFTEGSNVSKMVFYPSQTAKYKFFSATEKLVVARVFREHAKYGYLTGSVEGFTGTGSFDLVFTNVQNGNVVKATVADGKYTAQLAEGFDYTITLEGTDEYVITSDKKVNISDDTEMDMTVSGVTLVEVSGKVTGIADEHVKAFADAADFTFAPQDENSVYVPKISLYPTEDGIEYDVKLQKDVTYDVSVVDKEDTATDSYAAVEDYILLTTELTVANDDADVAIEFEAKPVYKVTIAPNGATLSDLAEAVFKFTRLDVENGFVADGYVYEFTGADNIVLRDGQYVVEVTNSGAFVQKRTTDLVVNGADVTKEISFSSDITEWDFSDPAFAVKFSNGV